MLKISNLFALCFIIFSTALACSAQETNEKGSLFIIGGGPRPMEMMQRIAIESGIDKGGYAVILPMSSEEPDSAILYTGRSFSKAGYNNIYGMHFEKGEKPNQSKTDSIRNA